MEKSYLNLRKGKLKNNEVEYEAEISASALENSSAGILAELALDFEMPGFRKGKAPISMVRKHINEVRLLEDAANDALRSVLKEIIEDEKLSILGAPHVNVTKLAPGNPVEFKVKFALAPEIKLADYRKISEKIMAREDNIEVTDKEFDNGKEPEKLPELTDEFIKKMGPFENVEAFKNQLKDNLLKDKKARMKQTKRDEIISEILKHSKLEVPPMFLEEELMDYTAERDEKLKETGKTADALLKEEQKLIEEQIKVRLIFGEIQKEEKLEADETEIHSRAERLEARYPDQEHHYLHHVAEAMILNEKVFEILENKKS
ncbi:MAG: trigger factor [Candidatus Wolfebacteria bacterium]|nr:trigger factor [Candidatus Wolfebacteria bacterium]